MHKKNIAFFIHSFDNGGAQRAVSNISSNIHSNYTKHLFIYRNNVEYKFEGNIVDLNVNELGSDRVTLKNVILKIWRSLVAIYKIKKFKKQYKIDTTVSFLQDPNIINILSRTGDKIIISARVYRSISDRSFKNKIYDFFTKLLYNKADTIVAVSEGIKQELIEYHGVKENKVKVIYNIVEIDTIQSLMDEKVDSSFEYIFSHPVIINVGRLDNQKGHWYLIRAFWEIKRHVKDAKLVILGRGPLENRLNKLVKDLKLENDIIFLGYVKNPFKYIKRADIFVLSSLYEGFSNALLEAMACGTPVISTDCQTGPEELLLDDFTNKNQDSDIIYGSYGILTPNFDGKFYGATDPLIEAEIKLAATAIHLLNDGNMLKYYGQLAEERAKLFNVRNIISQWEELL